MAAALLAGMGALPSSMFGAPVTEATTAKLQSGKSSPASLQQGAFERLALRHLGGGYGSWRRSRHPNGPGWSQAQVQRMARKRRNQVRHRATCKRRGR